MFVLFCCLSLRTGWSQVSVALVFDQEQYLADEALVVKVRVTNLSGRPVTFGRQADWLSFSVESKDNQVVQQVQEVPVRGEFSLETATTGIKKVDLAPCFTLYRSGRYSVRATVKVPEWNQEFTSPPATFDITSGTKLWETSFGVPSSAGIPEVRKYILMQSRTTKGLKMYVRIADQAMTRNFRVYALGPMVSFTNPEAQLDEKNNLCVLFQTGARAFNYCVIGPDGELAQKAVYEYGTTRPVLKLNADGKLGVVGGVRRPSPDDRPEAKPPEIAPSSDAKNPQP